jgi:Trk-type K+ transport system membrane component
MLCLQHLLYFTAVPLFASGILYASNGDTRIAWIDCLFMSFSALTVTGLNTVLLAELTAWQQTILFLLICAGSLTTISIATLLVRIYFFRRHFTHLIATSSHARRKVNALAKKV